MAVQPQRPDRERPPALVVLSAIAAFVGCVPGVFVALLGAFFISASVVGVGRLALVSGGPDGDVVSAVLTYGLALQAGLLAVGVPVLLTMGAVRLLIRRDRWMLVLAGLPVTALVAWQLLDEGLVGREGAWTLLLMVPAAAPLIALAPSVGRWVESGRAAATGRVPVLG